MSQNKIPEIVILSECSKEYKVGFELYKAYTGDTNFESPRDIHPTKNMTISNVCWISLVFLFLFGRMEDFSYFCTPTITH